MFDDYKIYVCTNFITIIIDIIVTGYQRGDITFIII